MAAFLRRARAMPATMAAGPVSPPMASIAMRVLASTAKRLSPRSGLGRGDFAAIVVATGRAEVVRQAKLAAIRAFLEIGRRQRVMAAAHVPLGRRSFSLRDSHCGTCLVK